jgi:2,4-dienoyl-CoA reductase-like NADH-dependent reductase (Old Yellow Enzyme family)
MTNSYAHVATPVQVGSVTFRNRITRTAHGTGFAIDGQPNERLIRYHEARARGGVGSLFLETCGVHPSSPGPLWAFEDRIVESMAPLAQRLRALDTHVLAQLWHGGAQAPSPIGGPSYAASPVADSIAGRVTLQMPKSMIDEVVGGFAAAARRMQEAGLTGVELHCAHTYLICSFLSPLTNRRDDEYGGSLENRTRFCREALAAVREACGPEFVVGVRINGSESVDGGIEPDEAAAIRARLERDGLVDFVNVSMGGYFNFSKMIGAMHEPSGYELATSTPVTREAQVPTIVTGRVTTLAQAERIIADGGADIVSMVRALLADPELVAKSLAGREADVRPCIGCNEGCVGRRFAVGAAVGQTGCTVNPEAGFEYRGEGVTPAPEPRSIMVVGAGPAGLEAAHTAARRGHRVTLYDAADEPGGAVRLSRAAPHRDDIGLICDWLWEQLQATGVETHLGHRVDLDLVRAASPDAVIVATGAQPRRDGLQRMRPALRIRELSPARVVTPLEVLGGRVRPPARAVVFDDLGNYQAIGSAERLLQQGAEVVFATSYPEFAPDLFRSFQRDAVLERLSGFPGFGLRTRATVEAVGDGTVTLGSLDSADQEVVDAGLLVLVTGFDPDAALAAQLRADGIETHIVGDAVAPLLMPHAIATGREAGAAV